MVQVIYLSLAILMGGGLVLFGIGGATPGGLVDAVTGQGSGGGGTDVYKERVERLQQQVATNPKDDEALADLARAQVQQASVEGYEETTGTYTKDGIAQLREAATTWERYVDLDPKKPDAGVAALMVNAYGPGALNQPIEATRALETLIEGRGPSAALYTQLAVQAYAAGDNRKSVIAEKRAVELSPERRRKIVKAQIAAQRKQIDRARIGGAAQGAGGQGQSPDLGG